MRSYVDAENTMSMCDTSAPRDSRSPHTYVRNEVQHGVADQSSDTKTQHRVNDVYVGRFVTKTDNQQTNQR